MIKKGGYATGADYQFYREHGHGPIGARLMTVGTIKLFTICGIVGIIGGLLSSCYIH